MIYEVYKIFCQIFCFFGFFVSFSDSTLNNKCLLKGNQSLHDDVNSDAIQGQRRGIFNIILNISEHTNRK